MVRKSVSPCWATFTPQPDSDSAGDAYQRSETSVEKLAAPALEALARARARMGARPFIEPPVIEHPCDSKPELRVPAVPQLATQADGPPSPTPTWSRRILRVPPSTREKNPCARCSS